MTGLRTAPISLPLVEVTFDDTGTANVSVDRVPAGEKVERRHLDAELRRLATERGPVRVHLVEADGAEFTDVLLPSPSEAVQPKDDAEPVARPGEFAPGESVMVALIVGRHEADSRGHTELGLPAAVLARAREVALIGADSGAVVIHQVT